MIRNDKEKSAAQRTLESLKASSPEDRFVQTLEKEIHDYEQWKKGDLSGFQREPISKLADLLIAARIAKGVSQRRLALKLGVHETQVSRDERNEYRGITIARALSILNALDVELGLIFLPKNRRLGALVNR